MPAMRIAGGVLVAIAAIMAVHTVAEPWYHVSTPDMPYSAAWNYIDPLELVAVVLGIAITLHFKRGLGRTDTVTWDWLATNALFYGFVFTAILFLWVWSVTINIQTFTEIRPDTISITWIYVDAMLPVLAGALGTKLLRGWRPKTVPQADAGRA